MAIVKLLQNTDMGQIALDNYAGTIRPNYSSIDILNDSNANGGYYFISGSFQQVVDPIYPPWRGIISSVVIDTLDAGYYPNIEITGLSMEFTNAYTTTC